MNQYRAVLAAADEMLVCAKKDAWGDVSRTAIAIGGITARLRNVNPDSFADDAARTERLQILTRLVEIDAQVRQLRDPWVARMDAMLSTPTQRRYSSPLTSAFDDSE